MYKIMKTVSIETYSENFSPKSHKYSIQSSYILKPKNSEVHLFFKHFYESFAYFDTI